MPDTVSLNEDTGIITVESHGVVSEKDIGESIEKVRKILNEKGMNRILVDTTRQEIMPDTMGIFRLFSTFPRDFKLAVLRKPSQVTADDLVFAENVGANRGVQIRLFEEESQALQWLNNG